jgi:hypothetical protein
MLSKLGAVTRTRDSKVSDLNLPILGDKDILGLQIAVDDARSVDGLYAKTHLTHKAYYLRDRDKLLPIAEPIGQIAAPYILHRVRN